MDKLYKKYKEDAKDSEERKTLVKTLIKMYFQNNAIRCILTNIISIGEITNEAKKYDLNINKTKKCVLSQ